MKNGKNKNKKVLFKKGIDFIKKKSETESKKSEKKKKIKQNKPKGMSAKRLGMFTFWSLFLFMLLVTVVSILFNGNASATDEDKQESKLYKSEGLEYTKDFVKKYFTWSADQYGKERRMSEIKPYLLNGSSDLDGVMYNNKWSSSINTGDINLIEIQTIDGKQARFIFKVKFTLKSPTDEDNTKPNEERLSFEDTIKEEKRMKVINGYKTKVTEKYISVPVIFDPVTNKFAVYSLPTFTYVNENSMEKKVKDNFKGLKKLNDSYVESNINAFLNTFFESYANDGRDKLSYILEDERHEYGLNGTMNFVEVKDSEILVTKEDEINSFVVKANVLMKEPTTEYEFGNEFLLLIKRKDQRYVVESLNNEEYINTFIDDYLDGLDEDELEKLEEKDQEQGQKENDFDYSSDDLDTDNVDEERDEGDE